MKCSKCAEKEINRTETAEIKCKVCKKKFKTKFTNVCYACQMEHHCILCGEKLI